MSGGDGFERLRFDVNGTDTVVLAAGAADAPPLVFFHGAGTFHGFAFAAPRAGRFRVLVPFHPGFGESGDFDGLRSIDDLVLHYGALFERLGLVRDVNLVGLSLGGLLAARFAIAQQHRLRRLVLTCPAGLRVPEHPADDLFRIPPEQLAARLAVRMETLLPHLPTDPHDLDFAVDRYRETRTVATMLWERPFDRVVPRWLGTVDVATMVAWGAEDALVPPGQAAAWGALLPNATVRLFADAGHLLYDESPEAVAAVGDFCRVSAPARALLFDVGDVLLESNWGVLDRFEAVTGRTVPGRGPLDPDSDPDWHRHLGGQLSLDAYWDVKARAAGFAERRQLWGALSVALGGDVFAPDALALVAEARAAGVATGILSNDLVASAGRAWVDTRPELAGFDVLVDATELGVRKPHPAPYLAAIEGFGLPADAIVFLDDTPVCIEGARAVGMIAVHVDPTRRAVAFDLARRLVGLAPRTDAEAVVHAAEVAYAAGDLRAVMAFFHPDVIVRWNGRRVANGWDETRRFHVERLGFGEGGGGRRRPGYRLRKTLRAVGPDSVGAEWTSSHVAADGTVVRAAAAEFWAVRYGRIIEWNAYHHRIEGDDEPLR